MPVDYSLYLVTDSTPAILGSKDLIDVVRQALEGGVTVVQYRDKHGSTKDLIDTARKLHTVTKEYGVPLLINDRVDVALAMGAEGAHVGQDDMDLLTARKILGPDAIIGVSCNTAQEAEIAAQHGADYLGIGTIFATPTKTDTKGIIGPEGCSTILSCLSSTEAGLKINTVAIGGLNTSNVKRVMKESRAESKSLSGVAVVSAIIAAASPKTAAQQLCQLVSTRAQRQAPPPVRHALHDRSDVLGHVQELWKRLRSQPPLCHNMTNLVVQNFAANVALAIGGKPIMSNDGDEAADLATFGGSLVINMGTANAQAMENYLRALKAYNEAAAPVLLDPVGAGATKVRRRNVKRLLAGGSFDVIKGNESEIQVVLGSSTQQQRGVDSSSTLTDSEKLEVVKTLAIAQKSVVLMTGRTDFLSDGHRTVKISNGHPLLGDITGSGCALGTTVAACIAVEREDKLLAVLSGVLLYTIASEAAISGFGSEDQPKRTPVEGPGTFVPAFIDSLNKLSSTAWEPLNPKHWLERAKIEVVS